MHGIPPTSDLVCAYECLQSEMVIDHFGVHHARRHDHGRRCGCGPDGRGWGVGLSWGRSSCSSGEKLVPGLRSGREKKSVRIYTWHVELANGTLGLPPPHYSQFSSTILTIIVNEVELFNLKGFGVTAHTKLKKRHFKSLKVKGRFSFKSLTVRES